MKRLFIFALVLALPLAANAQNTTHKIAYQGVLQLDGNADMSGSFHFRISLYNSATDGECITPTAECLWTDTFNNVPVTLGRFSILLGDGAALSDAVWQNDLVYLGIDVMHENDADFTALAGRQRIAALPVAARAETAKNYHVTGDLVVDGLATLDGGAVVDPSLTVNGNANVSGTTTTNIAHVNTEIRASRIEIREQAPGMLRITDNDSTPTDIIRIGEASPSNFVKIDDAARFILPVGGNYTSGGNADPEVRMLSGSGLPPCDRGSMFVGRASAAGDQDSLCVCFLMENGVHEWWCFNP